jgi:hypothetical protein
MIKNKINLLLFISVMTSGCSSTWYHPTLTENDFYRDREISIPDEQLTNNDNIEDALVIRAMYGGENMAVVRISERQNSTTTTNVIIQLARQ